MCGDHDLTKEHVFGKAFAAYLNVKVHWSTTSTPIETTTGSEPVKGSSPITNIAPPVLCGTCNKERLSGLMSSSLPYLKAITSGQSLTFTPEIILALRRYFERMALIVDVMTSNEQLTDKQKQSKEHIRSARFRDKPSVITFDERKAWLNGARLPQLKVLLGHHLGVMGLNPEFNPTIGQVLVAVVNGIPISRTVKRISIMIRALTVVLDIDCPMDRVPSIFEIEQISAWPTMPKVTYDQYLTLRHQDQRTRWLRQLLADKRGLAMFEAKVRQDAAGSAANSV